MGIALILAVRQTNRQTDMMKAIDALCDCVNVPKHCCIQNAVKPSELNNIQFCSTHSLSLLQQTAVHCSLIIMEVPVKQFIRSPPDFRTYVLHSLPV